MAERMASRIRLQKENLPRNEKRFQEKDKLREKCAVFGVYVPHGLAAPLVYQGLSALQHRGQETSGISANTNNTIATHKGAGLVSQVYHEQDMVALEGNIAIGHNRYSTSGAVDQHFQPITSKDNLVSLAHNGTLPQTAKLEAFLRERKIDTSSLNDSELMQRVVAYEMSQGLPIQDALTKSFPLFTGAFSLTLMTKDALIGMRDAHGIRPLSIGKLPNGGYVLSSETCGLDSVNAQFLRDVRPGEMVVINQNGLQSVQLAEGEEKLDIFEVVYFSRPDSKVYGKSINTMRREMGKMLAREKKINADMVIAVPNSSIPAAAGYAEESGIAYEPDALMKDSYSHRTFINPSSSTRAEGVRRKFVPIPEVLQGKSVVVIDDSIVRGTTMRELVAMLKGAGAKKVHLVISSPPVKYPDFYGIATPSQKELIASQMSLDEIRQFVGADSLQYLSFDGMIQAIGLPEEKFCTSCFTGKYPIPIGENAKDIDFSV